MSPNTTRLIACGLCIVDAVVWTFTGHALAPLLWTAAAVGTWLLPLE